MLPTICDFVESNILPFDCFLYLVFSCNLSEWFIRLIKLDVFIPQYSLNHLVSAVLSINYTRAFDLKCMLGNSLPTDLHMALNSHKYLLMRDETITFIDKYQDLEHAFECSEFISFWWTAAHTSFMHKHSGLYRKLRRFSVQFAKSVPGNACQR